jgi:hypothetical protein
MESDFLAAAALMGRVCLALVFATAAPAKIRHRMIFEGVVANYRLLPRGMVKPVARALPWIEWGLAALLVLPATGPGAAAIAILLLAAFAWAMAVNLRRGRSHIDCGCHQSTLAQTLSWSLVARNLCLAVLLLPSLAPLQAPLGAPAAIGAVAGACAFLLYLLFNTLASLPGFARSAA